MPKYKIQLKQGKRTIIAHGEFKSLNSLLAHYEKITTMKVSEVSEVLYTNDSTPPIDDFNYMTQFKGFVKNDDTRKSVQVVFNNLKMTLSDIELYQSIKDNMEIDNLRVDSIATVLFKK